MQNFQQILTEAAQLKEHQLKRERKGYQALPQFLKTGLGFNRKYEILRKQNFLFQYRVSNRVKQEGNSFFKQNKIEEALNKYEEALAIFRYIESRTYENLKDEDLSYHSFDSSSLPPMFAQKFESHMVAIYLNICSCLTKQNKKQDAIYSADQALKIKKTAKGHYKKAQAYLKYVNRDSNDIKLGILQLKEAYAIEKSEDILRQMYAAKEGYENQKEKSKNWFKFMFDKNKKTGETQSKLQEKQSEQLQKKTEKEEDKKMPKHQKNQLQELQKASKLVSEKQHEQQKQKFEQTKEKLKLFVQMPEKEWEYNYRKDFIKRHGSKIYSILRIYQYEQLANEFRLLMIKCYDQGELQANREAYGKIIEWMKGHPLEKISKYNERYDLQTGWIKQSRMVKKQQKQQSKGFEIEAGFEYEVESKEDEKILSTEQHDMIEQTLNKIQQGDIENERKYQNKIRFQDQNKQNKTNSTSIRQESRYLDKQRQEYKFEDKPRIQQQQTSAEQKKKYVIAGVVLFFILIRFLFF